MGKIEKLWIRPTSGGPSEALDSATAVAGSALAGDHCTHERRQITILERAAWNDACEAVGADLDPVLRRANVLVDGEIGGLRLAATIGKTIQLGSVRIAVLGETDPCDVMEKQHKGLTRALAPEGRGGVFGQVLDSGEISLGDSVELASAQVGSE